MVVEDEKVSVFFREIMLALTEPLLSRCRTIIRMGVRPRAIIKRCVSMYQTAASTRDFSLFSGHAFHVHFDRTFGDIRDVGQSSYSENPCAMHFRISVPRGVSCVTSRVGGGGWPAGWPPVPALTLHFLIPFRRRRPVVTPLSKVRLHVQQITVRAAL